MTLVIALNVIFSALVVTAIVGSHAWAIVADRREHRGATPAAAPRRQGVVRPRARKRTRDGLATG